MNQLPSVLDFLTGQEKKLAIFLKPVLGKEMKAIHKIGFGHSPRAEVLAIRVLILKENMVVPFHIHEEKEKLYVFDGPGIIDVCTVRGERFTAIPLREHGNIIVPPKTPHFVKYFPRTPGEVSRTLVISSSQNGDDIRWEEGVDALIKKTE